MKPIEIVKQALATANHRLAVAPSFVIYQSIRNQLKYLLGVLKGTELDRSRLNQLNFGLYAVKEFEDSDPEFGQVLHQASRIAAQLEKGIKVPIA